MDLYSRLYKTQYTVVAPYALGMDAVVIVLIPR